MLRHRSTFLALILLGSFSHSLPALSEAMPPTVVFVLAYESADAPEPSELPKALRTSCEIFRERLSSIGIASKITHDERTITIRIPTTTPEDLANIRRELSKTGRIEFRRVHPDSLIAKSERPDDNKVPPDGFEAQFLESRRHGSDSIHREVLWVKLGSEISPRSIQLAYLTKVLGGRFEVTVEFTAKGKEQFAAITRELADERRIDGRPRRLAIVADGQVLAAPVIMMPLREGRATITGSFTEREALEFCNRLNTPLHLPSIIEQYSE